MSDINQSVQTLSMRLIFQYEGDQVRLVTQQPVDVSITGVDLTHTQREGYYVYTSDASGRVLARVLARGAFQHGVEVFPERAGEPITRMDVDRPRGAFTVIVPVPQNADHVRVMHVVPALSNVSQPAARVTSQPVGGAQERELARFPLRLSR